MRLLARLYTVFSPMQAGRPSISADPYDALGRVFTVRHRRAAVSKAASLGLDPELTLHPPMLPLELQGTPDLGALAIRGPYAGYLRTVSGSPNRYEWDLRELSAYSHRSDLRAPWAHVLFEIDQAARMPRAIHIETELGTAHPGDRSWPRATRLALCAATTHTALVRHWTWTHMIGGEYFAYATRAHLPENHPLCRLLWPHMAGTHASNRLATLGQLVPAGDFEAIYSFSYPDLCRVVSQTAKTFDLVAFDPEADGQRRGITSGDLRTPTLENCLALFRIMETHAARYIRLYYSDDRLQQDQPIREWLEELGRRFPTGNGLNSTPVTCDSLAKLVARLIYMAAVHHEQVGTHLWHYQLWPHVHPVRVYQDGRRLPEDIYQRTVNNNYVLNVVRTPLISDLSPVALDEPTNPERTARARERFLDFRMALRALQARMEREPWAPWKLYPGQLEANINA
jgi:arachidonate 15-lipoxygenase